MLEHVDRDARRRLRVRRERTAAAEGARRPIPRGRLAPPPARGARAGAHRPAPQPPTLAGQLGERLRDRTRVSSGSSMQSSRPTSLSGSTPPAETAWRSSSRRGGTCTLEWVIILLLAAEVVLITVDILAARTPS